MMKKLFTAFIFVLFTSNSYAGLKCLDGLRSIISSSSSKSFKVVRRHDRYWRYRKYENGENFVAAKNKLIYEIDFWSQVGERDIRLRELRKKQARSLVSETIKLDRPEISFVILRPIFTKTQISFFKMQRNNLITEKLLTARKYVTEGNLTKAQEVLAELKNNYQVKETIGANVSQIDRVLTQLENNNIDITINFAKKYAEYTETYEILHALASKPGKLQAKAKEVLDLLSPIELITEQFEHFAHFEPIGHVNKEMLREIVINNRISEVIYLRHELRSEKWSSIISRLSATQIYELTDAIVKKFPWLNTPSIRSHIRYTVDNKEILTHYPNIDRMVADGNSPKVMWEYLLSLDARDRTTDSLIRTFSRRIDTRVEWRSVKEYGALRAKKLREQGHNYDLEVRLYDKMIEMEKSVLGLPPLAPWHRSGNTQFVRFIIDGVLLGAFAYGSYYFLGDLLPDNKEEEKATSSSLPDTTSSSSSADTTSSSVTSGNSTTVTETATLTPEIKPSSNANTEDIVDAIEKAATDVCGQFASCPVGPN